MKRTLIIIVLIFSLVSAACSTNQLNRALNLLSTVPIIVQQLHLPNEGQILSALSEIQHAIEVFRDNPTRANYRNALSVIDGLIARNVFHVNASLLAVILAVRAILDGIIPQGALERVESPDGRVSPKAIMKVDVDRLEQKVRELKESAVKK